MGTRPCGVTDAAEAFRARRKGEYSLKREIRRERAMA